MNLLLLNTPATGGKLEQALEKLIDFGMDAGKDILIAILIYVIGRFIIRQISALVAISAVSGRGLAGEVE